MNWYTSLSRVFPIFATVLSYTNAVCPPVPPSTRTTTRLRQEIFCDYDRLSRPVKNPNDTVPLYITFDINNIEMDDHKQSMYLEGIVKFMWSDQFISWAPWKYDDITYIKVDEGEIWVPDLTLNLMNMHGIEDMKPSSCVASFTGTILCLPKLEMSAPCQQDVHRWPYDVHNCTFVLSSYMYYEHQLNFSSMTVDTKHMKDTRAWDLLGHKVVRKTYNFSSQTPAWYYPYAEVSITIRRHSSFFAAATVLPAVLMLTIVLSTFWMGSIGTTRIQICGLVMLGCTFFLSYIMYLIPANGMTVPVIITLFRDCMALSVFGIIIAAVGINLQGSQSRPPAWITSMTNWLELSIVGQLLVIVNAPTAKEDEAAIIEPTSTNPSPWLTFITLLDRISFIVSLLVTIILLMGYLP